MKATKNNKQTFRLPRTSDDEFLDLEYKITIYKTLNKLKIKYKNMSKEQALEWKIEK